MCLHCSLVFHLIGLHGCCITRRFYFQLQSRAMALLLTGHMPIGQFQSILVACQPQMPEACPRFLSPYMMKSAGSHSLELRKVASYTVLGQ